MPPTPAHPDPQGCAPADRAPRRVEEALIVAALRRLYRQWQQRAASEASEDRRAAYREAMGELEQLMAAHGGRRAAWEAIREDLVRTTVARLDGLLRERRGAGGDPAGG